MSLAFTAAKLMLLFDKGLQRLQLRQPPVTQPLSQTQASGLIACRWNNSLDWRLHRRTDGLGRLQFYGLAGVRDLRLSSKSSLGFAFDLKPLHFYDLLKAPCLLFFRSPFPLNDGNRKQRVEALFMSMRSLDVWNPKASFATK